MCDECKKNKKFLWGHYNYDRQPLGPTPPLRYNVTSRHDACTKRSTSATTTRQTLHPRNNLECSVYATTVAWTLASRNKRRDCCIRATVCVLCNEKGGRGSFGRYPDTLHLYICIHSFSDQFFINHPNQPRLSFSRSFQAFSRGRHFAVSSIRTGIVFRITRVSQNIGLSFCLNRGWLQQLVVGWPAHNFA